MPTLAADYPGKSIREGFEALVVQHKTEIKNNPQNAEAYAALAEVHIIMWAYGFIPYFNIIEEVKQLVQKALELDANNGLAHSVLGLIKMSQWDWQGCEPELKKGVELAPKNAGVHHWYGLYLACMKRYDEAYKWSGRAAKIDPTGAMEIGIASIYYFDHKWPELAEMMEKLIEKEPEYAPGYDWLGMAYIMMRQDDKSIEVYRKADALSDGLGEILGGLGHAYGIAGRTAEAKEVLNRMLKAQEKYHMPPIQIAFIYASLWDRENMYAMLERAFKENSWELMFIQTEAWFDDFREEERFKELVGRIKFPA